MANFDYIREQLGPAFMWYAERNWSSEPESYRYLFPVRVWPVPPVLLWQLAEMVGPWRDS
jgi:hypothetical protein